MDRSIHEVPWSIHGVLWNSMECHGVPWISMEFHGIPWSIDRVPHGMPSSSMDCPWSSKEFHGVPWSIDGVLWNVMKFHGVSMTSDIHSLQFL